MDRSEYIESGNLVFAVKTQKEREKDGFLADTILTFQISGKLAIETSTEKLFAEAGDILLVRKNQLLKVSKSPYEGEDYRTITILFKEEELRKFALKRMIKIHQKYKGKQNIFIPKNDFLICFFSSLLPYGERPKTYISATLGQLKMEESLELLLQTMPELKYFLFDFSEPYKVDLEKFMSLNYQFNIPIEEFAKLTGRSLAGFKRDFQKTFSTSPRKWLQNKRMEEAYYLIENHHKKPSEIYLELGFESLSHFSNSFKDKFGISPTNFKISTHSRLDD